MTDKPLQATLADNVTVDLTVPGIKFRFGNYLLNMTPDAAEELVATIRAAADEPDGVITPLQLITDNSERVILYIVNESDKLVLKFRSAVARDLDFGIPYERADELIDAMAFVTRTGRDDR